MKWAIAEVLLILAFCAALLAMYDAGKRTVVRSCVNFHTFTYDESAWHCQKMRTVIERKREEKAEEAKATQDWVEI